MQERIKINGRSSKFDVDKVNSKLIAPCGMNCSLCIAYLRDKNTCPGCRKIGEDSDYCKKCAIKNCKVILRNNWKFCSPKCDNFPCKRLKNLDKRYTEKYEMSMIDNLNFIDKKGIRKFVQNEKKKWIKAGKIYCVHRKEYFKID